MALALALLVAGVPRNARALLSAVLTLACSPSTDTETAGSEATSSVGTSTGVLSGDAPTSTAVSTSSSGAEQSSPGLGASTSTGGVDDASTEATHGDGTTGTIEPLPECGAQPLPGPCLDDAVTMPPQGTAGTQGPHAVVTSTLANPHPAAPGEVTVYLPDTQEAVPVVFFSHAYGATDPLAYVDMANMLASNGMAMVHVPYPSMPVGKNKNDIRYTVLWDGFVAATEANVGEFDLTRVGFVGHSFGGGATPDMARRGYVDKGWGENGKFMFILAPWYSWGIDYETLPADIRTVIEVYADDEANDHQIAVSDVWDRLPADLERAWLMIRSDACGCGLNATHTAPMSRKTLTPNPENVLNGYDRWGVWRRVHALAGYAFTGEQGLRSVAFGEDSGMGMWTACDGAVRALEASATTPITSACLPVMFSLADRCTEADPDYVCL